MQIYRDSIYNSVHSINGSIKQKPEQTGLYPIKYLLKVDMECLCETMEISGWLLEEYVEGDYYIFQVDDHIFRVDVYPNQTVGTLFTTKFLASKF